ncbi:hypothetical protein AKJ09_03779 [Labilithrix luteola]|uniref:Lipoprotein n=1 Tax=Labilithrix luteola TaxID=1391654 RepID=A0A0K1PUA4_9BACT|nr:hypothetical protein [Labilithrix luteola]AKU97115.1 hypothetical protein AKJ09_03779 [Labilithrix luteola]
MRRLVMGAVLALASSFWVAGCTAPPPPIAPLKHAFRSEGLRVQLLRAAELDERAMRSIAEPATVALESAMADDLRGAGYVLVDSGPWDLASSFSSTVRQRGEDESEYDKASVKLFDKQGKLIDRIAFEFNVGVAPVKEPSRVSRTLVNAIVESRAVTAIAKQKAKAAPDESDADDDASSRVTPKTK